MLDVAQSENSKNDSKIVPSAMYNMGRAYFMVCTMYIHSLASDSIL